MAKVVAYKGEDVTSLLKRFKQAVKKEDIMYEVKRREYYVCPAMARKLKSEHARKFKKIKRKKVKLY